MHKTPVLRDDGFVVTHNGADLSDRCIKCGSSAVAERKKVDVTYFPRWTLVTIPLGALFFTPLSVHVGLCKRHASKWREDVKLNVPLVLVGIGLFAVAWLWLSLSVFVIGLVCFATGFLRSAVGADPVRLGRYKEPAVWLRGAGNGYLAQLSALNSPETGA